MHAHELLQLADYVASLGSRLVQSGVAIPEPALNTYWTASKCRIHRWSRAMKALASIPWESHGSGECSSRRGDSTVLDEILMSDVLCRTWMAICRALDLRRGVEEASPISESVLAGQTECRQRALNLMVYGQGIGVEHAVSLNRRRLKHEHRTDWLLSFLAPLCDVSDLVFKSRRVERWAIAKRGEVRETGNDWIASVCMSLSGLGDMKASVPPTGNEDLNRRIACAILGSFPPSIFDTTGCVGSIRYLRLWQASTDTQGHVNFAHPTDPKEGVDAASSFQFRRRFEPPGP